MPCGGIYPVTVKETMVLNCWICGTGGADHFIEEWDAYLHYECAGKFLASVEGEIVLSHGHTVVLQKCEKTGD